MHLPVRYLVGIPLAFALAACADSSTGPGGGVLIQPDAVAYHPGDEAALEVTNLLRSSIQIGFCPEGMYREDGADAGTLVTHTLPCPAVALTLRPGHSMSMSMALPEGTAAGEYRFAVRYSVGSSSRQSKSAAVQVQVN
jgi:hypothetical protein